MGAYEDTQSLSARVLSAHVLVMQTHIKVCPACQDVAREWVKGAQQKATFETVPPEGAYLCTGFDGRQWIFTHDEPV